MLIDRIIEAGCMLLVASVVAAICTVFYTGNLLNIFWAIAVIIFGAVLVLDRIYPEEE